VAVAEEDLQAPIHQVPSIHVVEVKLFGPVGERRLTGTRVLPLALREEVTSDEGVERFVSVLVHHPSSLHNVHLELSLTPSSYVFVHRVPFNAQQYLPHISLLL
jgi:hypothetical protein